LNTLSDGPLRAAHDGLRVAIRLLPRAKVDGLLAVADTPAGRVLKASVTAPPEAGRANEALLRLLARTWHLPRRDLAIIAGSRNRDKAVQVSGDPQQLIDKITSQIAGLPGW
jgi:uncharacterized protein